MSNTTATSGDSPKLNALSTTRVTGSEALILSLIAEGVDTIFGYPGGAIMQYMMLYLITRIKLSIFWYDMNRGQPMLHKVMPGYLTRLVCAW